LTLNIPKSVHLINYIIREHIKQGLGTVSISGFLGVHLFHKPFLVCFKRNNQMITKFKFPSHWTRSCFGQGS